MIRDGERERQIITDREREADNYRQRKRGR